jgi:hypothetical protein
MNKFLITLVAALSFAVAGVANAEMTMSGNLSQFVAMGDKIDGGVTSKFNRMTFGANTTTDNGWTVGGSFAAEFMSVGQSGKGHSAYLPTSNSMYIQTDMGTAAIGHTADGVTALVPRIGAMVPGGGHDAGYQYLYDAGNGASNGVGFAEAYYAIASSRVDVRLPSVNGFSVGVSYTPSLEFDPSAGNGRAQSANPARHGETVHAAVSYSGETEGMSYTIALGSITGNAQGNSATGTLATFTNNDLNAVTGAVKVVSGNVTIGAHWYNNGDSFGASADAIQASDDGYTIAVEYAMGNITLGALYAHQELVYGTRAATHHSATTIAAAQAGQVYEDDVRILGVGYNMGGGVNTFVQYNQMSHTDGTHATTTDVDPSVLIAGITLGF